MDGVQEVKLLWASRTALVVMCLTLSWRAPVLAAELPDFEATAERLQHAVVTVRVQAGVAGRERAAAPQGAGDDVVGEAAASPKSDSGARVTVCTGVLLERGLIVTPIYAGSDCQIRVTLAGGEQATARVRVIDEYSGLSLLKTDNIAATGLPLAETLPKLGGWVLSGSGWGAEQPVISFGIVSGAAVTVPNSAYPPLIRCDLRTAETSSGAAVVDARGRLVGIIVLSDHSRQNGGWTYAVPVRHVRRLVRTLGESDAAADSIVVLKRRRPEVGMVLEGNGEEVVVGRVRPNSPADKAGIQVGDRILAADDVKIRSVYQALRPVLKKQPGDTVKFLVKRHDTTTPIQVVLGGGIELPSAPFDTLSKLIRPKINLQGLPQGGYRAWTGEGRVREVLAPAASSGGDNVPAAATDTEKIKLLEKALDRYRNVIVYLQDHLKRSEHQRLRSETLVRSLEAELKALREKKSR